MNVSGLTFSGNYLEYLPLNKITKYQEGPPKNGTPFTGYPRQHPSEKGKLLLVYDPLGDSPALLEFKVDDVLYVEEVPQAITEDGEGVPLVKLWIRRGARGMLLEPFEVDESLFFPEFRKEQKERFGKNQAEAGGGFSSGREARL